MFRRDEVRSTRRRVLFAALLVMAAPRRSSAFQDGASTRPDATRAADDPADVRRVCEDYAEAKSALAEGDPESAIEFVRAADARRLARLAAVHLEVGDAAGSAGAAFFARGRVSVARALFETSRDVYLRLLDGGNRRIELALNGVATCLQAEGRFEEALAVHSAVRALRERSAPEGGVELASTIEACAACLDSLGRSRDALPLFESAYAMQLRAGGPDRPTTHAAANSLATCLMSLGRAAEAAPIFADVVASQRRLLTDRALLFATASVNLAQCLARLGRVDEALVACDEAVAALRRAGSSDHPVTASAIAASISLRMETGRAAEAHANALEVLAIRRRLLPPDHPGIAHALGLLGATSALEGRFDEALKSFEAARAAATASCPPDHPDLARANAEVGHCLMLSGRLEEALVPLASAVASDRRSGSTAAARHLRLLATALRRLGRLGEAERSLEEAASLLEGTRRDAARLIVAERADYDRALRATDVFAELAAVRAERGDAGGAFAAVELGRRRGALDVLSSARVDALDMARRAATAAGDAEALRRLTEATRASDEADREVAACAAASDALARRSDLAEAERVAVAARLDERRAAAWRGLKAAESARSALLAAHLPLGRPASTAEAAETLRDDERILAYSVGAAASRVFLVRPRGGGVVVRDVVRPDGGAVGNDELSAEVARHRALLEAEGRASARRRGIDEPAAAAAVASAHEAAAEHGVGLFRTLVPEDLRSELTRARRIVLLPDGPLSGLPFESLVVARGATPADCVYWLDVGPEISVSTSAAAFVASRRRSGERLATPPTWEVVAVGDPAPRAPSPESRNDADSRPRDVRNASESKARAPFERARTGLRGLPSLPGARREVLAIKDAVDAMNGVRESGSRARVLLGAEATESSVFAAAASTRVLHFAVHHVADEGSDGLLSALVLSPPEVFGPEDDGLLTVRDLLSRWRDHGAATDLVVLAACESDGGPTARSDRGSAMPLAFLFTGVRSVVATLWRVEDESAAELMTDFYRRLYAKKPESAESSRLGRFTAARKALKARRPEPYFWAPYAWSGDPD